MIVHFDAGVPPFLGNLPPLASPLMAVLHLTLSHSSEDNLGHFSLLQDFHCLKSVSLIHALPLLSVAPLPHHCSSFPSKATLVEGESLLLKTYAIGVRTTYALPSILLRGPGSSVGIATDYGLDCPGSNPGGDEIFRPSRPALGPTQPPVQWVPDMMLLPFERGMFAVSY